MADVISRALGDQILGKQQRDYNHADDSQYKELRDAANRELDQAHALSEKSQAAFKSGDKSRAHELSEESKQHRSKGEELNMQAAQWVFRANNADSEANEIDLHGLYVKESLSALDSRVEAARRNNESQIRVITGKGIHSQSHQAKLKPAVQDYCKENGLSCHVDEKNTGVVVIDFTGQGQQPSHQQPSHQQPSHQQPSHQQPSHQQPSHQQGQQNQEPDLMQQVNKYLALFKQIKKAFRSCLG